MLGFKSAPLRATVSRLEQRAWWPPSASVQRTRRATGPRSPHCPASRAARPHLGPVLKVPLGKEPPLHQVPRKGAGHAPWEAPRVGKNPSGPSRPPYLTGAASPGRNHGAASPVRLLRRRHLPAPGPRPRRQPRPVPDGASAIARDFTLAGAASYRIRQERISHASRESRFRLRKNQFGHRTPPPLRLLSAVRSFSPSRRSPCFELPDFLGGRRSFSEAPFPLLSRVNSRLPFM